ncbi:MAG TPA: hypothetical protein VFE13_07270 [Caulobacteraceae bacterium]|nr:hypothetical protein [Caulobacteraceae bacterium]
MSGRPDALRYALATLTAVALVGLGVRLGAQAGDLATAQGALADAQQRQAALRATIAGGLGPPLLDASRTAPTEQLTARLKSLGFEVRRSSLAAATPAGRAEILARFAVDARADAGAIDRLSLWAQANARSAILETLSATAGADGKSDVRLELDAIVKVAPPPPGERAS